jgi:excisionase family DNA binding protein
MTVLQTSAPLRRSISVGTAARITGLHASTIRRALLRGDLEGYRTGRRGPFRIPAGALDAWIRPASQEHPDADRYLESDNSDNRKDDTP